MPPPHESVRYPSVRREKRKEHSEKPDWAYDMVEKYYPNTPKIELFARKSRPGWASWGTKENEKRVL
jgi:N6-adenosine-specific RNA methylase IME4